MLGLSNGNSRSSLLQNASGFMNSFVAKAHPMGPAEEIGVNPTGNLRNDCNDLFDATTHLRDPRRSCVSRVL